MNLNLFDLPNELLVKILTGLPVGNIAYFRCVNKISNFLLHDEFFWKNKIILDFKSYKKIYVDPIETYIMISTQNHKCMKGSEYFQDLDRCFSDVILKKDFKLAKYFLSKGATTKKVCTLDYATLNDLDMIKFLMMEVEPPEVETALCGAAISGQIELFEYLLRMFNPNLELLSSVFDFLMDEQDTIFESEGVNSIAKYLLAENIKVDCDALMLDAAAYGDLDMIILILENRKEELFILDYLIEECIMYANKYGKDNVVGYLTDVYLK